MVSYKIALIPGSFDPPTVGHLDVVERAVKMFDEVWVTAFVNSSKAGRFTAEERLAMLQAAFGDIKGVHVDVSKELLADYAVSRGIGVIVKGARNATDFDYELSLSLINRSLENELDTVILPTRSEYAHVSSTMVSEMIRYGRDYTPCVPKGVAALIGKFCK